MMLLLLLVALCNLEVSALRPSEDHVDLSAGAVGDDRTWFQLQCLRWAQTNVRDLGNYMCWSEAAIEQVSAWDQLISQLDAIVAATPTAHGAKDRVKTLLAKIKKVQAQTVKLNKNIQLASAEDVPAADPAHLLVMLGQYFAASLHEVPDTSSSSSDQVKLAMKTPGTLIAAIADCAAALQAAIPVITGLGDSFPSLNAKQIDPEPDAPRTKFTKEGFVQTLVNWLTWPRYFDSSWNTYCKEVIPKPETGYMLDKDGGVVFDHGESDPIHSGAPYNLAADSLRVSHEYLVQQFAAATAAAYP